VHELAGVVAVFVVTTLVVCVCCAAAAVHMLRVRNRVSPAVKTPAPLAWLWSPRAAARLHRRLRRSVLGAQMSLDAASSFADLRDEVDEVEALNQRVVAMARTRRPDLGAVRERLDALDAALRELEAPPTTA
jgi:hypothetical protein